MKKRLKSFLHRCPPILLTITILVPAAALLLLGAFVAAIIILPWELLNSLENFDRAP